MNLLYTPYTTRDNIEIIIDVGTLVLLKQYSSSFTFQQRWNSQLLKDDVHTIQLLHPGGSHYVDIDAIEVIAEP